MNAIDNLVFNTLVKQDAVYLPGIGCLKVAGSKTQHSGSKVSLPKLTVVFSKTAVKNSASIVDLIAQSDGVDNQGAQTLYGEWLSSARRDDGKIVIEGVGVIGSKGFTPDAELLAALNGGTVPDVACNTRKCKCCWIWWLVAALVVVAAVLCYFFCCPCCSKEAAQECVVVEVVESEPAVETPVEAVVPETTIAPVGKARYNISVGVFEFKDNARKCAAADPVGIGAENYLIAPFPNGWEVVIAYSTDDWNEAVAAWRKYRTTVPDVWIYRKY